MALLEKDSLPTLYARWQGLFFVEPLHSSLVLIYNFLSAHFPIFATWHLASAANITTGKQRAAYSLLQSIHKIFVVYCWLQESY